MNDPNSMPTWDGAVLASALGLTAFGVLMNYSTTAALDIQNTLPPLAVRHAVGVGCALVLAALAARMPLSFWQRSSPARRRAAIVSKRN